MAKIKVTARRDSTANCKLLEFMATGDDVCGRGAGGLISITVGSTGTVNVEVYRADPGVDVMVNGRRYHAARGTR